MLQMRSLLLVVVSAAYLIALVELTLVRFPQEAPEPNPVPMRTIAACWASGGRTMAVNVLGNLALLAPVGVLLPMARPGKVRAGHVLLAALALSGAVEAAQLAGGRRTADVDDLILNTIGAIAAYSALMGASGAARVVATIAAGGPPRPAFAGPHQASDEP